MSDSRNFAALDWVVHEIVETLQQAREALEAYVENPEDQARLRFCLTHVHQVHGSLQMVEFYGAAMLAEEMEGLTQSMIDGGVENGAEAQEVLMRAILQFPRYLEKAKVTRRDNPLMVLPLLNDLRTVRGENLLTETNLFSPYLAPAHKVSGDRLPLVENRQQFQETVRKLRQMYQYAAAGFIRSVNADENLAYLKKVFARLYKLTNGTARQPLWHVCVALAEALEMDAIESSVSIKNLLRQLDKELKLLVVHGPKSLDTFTDDELIKNLLYYVARSGKHAPGFSEESHLQQVYESYELDRALPEGRESGEDSRDMLSAPDAEAMRSVVTALKAELDIIKQALDLSLSGGDRQETLAEALPVIKRVGDTMAVLGIGDLRKQVLEQGAALELVVNSDSDLSDDELMAVAGKVLDIENRLDNLAAGVGNEQDADQLRPDLNLSQAHESVLRESRSGLEQAKDAIIEYIASQWERGHLQQVPSTLRGIRGGLEMIPLPRPARIVGACARFVQEQLLPEEAATPEWSKLDTLADAITSVEYYLERFNSERREENELLLGVAEDSVAQLGYAVAKSTPAPSREAVPDDTQLEDDGLEQTALTEAYENALSGPESVEGSGPEGSEQEDPEQEDVELNKELYEHDASHSEEAGDEDYSLDSLTEEVAAADAEDQSSEPEENQPEESQPETEASSQGDADDEFDEEILEIFVEEAGEVSEAIAEYFPRWAQDFEDEESLTEFRRAFHTLKGSGRMVGATDIGELAWSIENMLNRVIDGTVAPTQSHVDVIEQVRQILPDMIEAFRTRQSYSQPQLAESYAARAEALSKGEVPDEDEAPDEPKAENPDPQEEQEPAESAPAETLEELSHRAAESMSKGSQVDEDDEPDAQLWDIFGIEALTHLQAVEQYIQDMEEAAPLFTPPSDTTQRALHTLKGSAHMADITPVAELVSPLERFVKELRTYQVDINEDILQLLRDAVDYTTIALANIEQGKPVEIPRLQQFVARVNELREIFVAPLVRQQEAESKGLTAVDPELLAIFMAEEMNLLLDADKTIDQWRTEPDHLELLQPLEVELATLTNGARHANQPPMAELGDKLHRVYQRLLGGELHCSDELCETLKAAHMALLDLVDAVAVGQNLEPAPAHITDALEQLLAQTSAAAPVEEAPAPEEEEVEAETDSEIEPEAEAEAGEAEADTEPDAYVDEADSEEAEATAEPETETEAQIEAGAETEPDVEAEAGQPSDRPEDAEAPDTAVEAEEALEADSQEAADDEADDEIVEIFVEEADELIEVIESALHEWQDDWDNPEWPEELKRALHTLKGGARLAGIRDVGDLAHDFETLLIGLSGEETLDQSFFQRLNQFQDQILAGVERTRVRLAGGEPPPAPESADAPQAPEIPEPPAHIRGEEANVVPFTPKPKPAQGEPQPPAVHDGQAVHGQGGGQGGAPNAQVQHLAARRTGPQEVVKVSADLLEELVNLAGETSITRGRIEEQVGDLGLAIDEMDSTIVRLQEQLRRLDIETEAQVLFRQEQLGVHEDFDPLEMDRYSQLQQLSRSLIESASDLLDLKNTLTDKNRDTETLLLQQSRINTDLQEGLMRSRMVPFSRLVPRLRRIVRQAASELGKEVNFELDNVEGELDRSVLERMVAPLEHMLRNAVDHGIEPADERVKAGKPEAGHIALSLSREGGEVLLRLVDDGRGINLNRVREKAIERGLMSGDAQLSDRDIMQFILHAGFSTADKVTQISGRGVGMDVVHSEIKQLGGSMFINSEWGEGTEFIVRLPFTVSVNRALMIQIRDDYYAIPLNTIEGIVRISPFELEHYYQDENALFEYAGEEYQVRYLGGMLDSQARPKLDGQALPLPVVLVRSAEHTLALQVDRLLGSREIVVKTLGVQFSTVTGVSGATVMGDGSVVVILDPHALMREKLALGMPKATLLEPEQPRAAQDEDREMTVMVVDDSVTVRKVTGRFLEREGFRVITAKDGAEALMTLQDHIPDVMLLDIEMPRMDGFEVAKNIRSSSRLKDIPIIMITSRTGEKHRERAFSLGVDRYLGKPYHEELLLTNIRELLELGQS